LSFVKSDRERSPQNDALRIGIGRREQRRHLGRRGVFKSTEVRKAVWTEKEGLAEQFSSVFRLLLDGHGHAFLSAHA
jgi:hypothetical protein